VPDDAVTAGFVLYTKKGGITWYDDVVVRVSYTVIEDPGVLSIARELIKAEPPFPAGQGRGGGQAIDWARASIAVLKVIVELANRGGKPVYYVTNAFCEVLFNATMHDDRFKPIMWRVENPIALPRIVVEEGHVLPLAVACTLDLRYSKIQPRTSITNEYYYIVTKPFRGTIEATASICSKPLSSTCKTIGDSVYVDIAG